MVDQFENKKVFVESKVWRCCDGSNTRFNLVKTYLAPHPFAREVVAPSHEMNWVRVYRKDGKLMRGNGG